MELPNEFLNMLPDSEVSLIAWQSNQLVLEIVKDATREVSHVHFSDVEFVSLLPTFTSDRWMVQPASKANMDYANLSLSEKARCYVMPEVGGFTNHIIAHSVTFDLIKKQDKQSFLTDSLTL